MAFVTDAGRDAVDAAAFCARRDRGAGWRKACERSTACGRGMLQRTAKSCGPDAPMLASSSRRQVGPTGLRQNLNPQGDGGKTARSPGRARRKPLKPLRAGTSGDSGVLVVTRVRSTTTKCTRGRGCQGHPAFPTPSMGGRFINGSGASRGEVAKLCLRRSFKAIAPHFQSSSPAKEPVKNADLILRSLRSKRLEGWTQRTDSRPSFETRARARSSEPVKNTDLILRSLRSKRLEGWTQRMDSRPSFETRARARSSG